MKKVVFSLIIPILMFANVDKCLKEIKKNNFDIDIVKTECKEAAEKREKNREYGEASYFYMLSGEFEYNIKNILPKIDKKRGNFSNIAHSFVMVNNLDKAKEYYYKFIKIRPIYINKKALEEDFEILSRLYENKKSLIDKGHKIWQEVYKPLNGVDAKYQEAIEVLKKRDYKSAIKKIRELENTLIESKLQNDYALAYLRNSYIMALCKENEYDKMFKAIESYEQNIKQSSELFFMYQVPLSCFEEKKEYQNSIDFIKKLIKKTENGTINSDKKPSLYIECAYFYKHLNRYDKAIECIKKALDLIKDDKLKIRIMATITDLYKEKKDYKKFVEYELKTLDLKKKLYGKDSLEAVAGYYYVAGAYKESKDYKNAINYLQKALKYNIYHNGERDSVTKKLYKELSTLYYKIGNKERAYNYLKKYFGR